MTTIMRSFLKMLKRTLSSTTPYVCLLLFTRESKIWKFWYFLY